MTRFGEGLVSTEQLYAAHVNLGNIQGGDPKVLQELGYCVEPDDILRHAACAVEAAAVLRRLEEPDPYAGLTGKQLFRVKLAELRQRQAS